MSNRLTKDGYKRPVKTATDKLTIDEIEDLLEDYNKVTDISTVKIGVHIRYFSIIKGKKSFRFGGILFQNDKANPYIVLGNGTKTWSVQKEGSVFFRKLSFDEVKDEYDKHIEGLENTIKKLETKIEDYRDHIRQLTNRSNK